MAEYIHLVGVEQVQSAANRMITAAELMNRAVNNMSEVLCRHEKVMQDLMIKIDDLIDAIDEEEEE